MKYLKKYKKDKLSFKELYHLNEIGFDFNKTKGVLILNNGKKIEVNRKTRKITYPDSFKNLTRDSKYNYLNYDSLALIHYVKSNFYDVGDAYIELDYKIEGLEDRELIRINRKLISLEHQKYIKDYQIKEDVEEFAKIVCTKTNITSMDVIIECAFRWKSYYASLSSIWIYLSKYIDGEVEIEEY